MLISLCITYAFIIDSPDHAVSKYIHYSCACVMIIGFPAIYFLMNPGHLITAINDLPFWKEQSDTFFNSTTNKPATCQLCQPNPNYESLNPNPKCAPIFTYIITCYELNYLCVKVTSMSCYTALSYLINMHFPKLKKTVFATHSLLSSLLKPQRWLLFHEWLKRIKTVHCPN